MTVNLYTNIIVENNTFRIVESSEKPQKQGSALATLNKMEAVAEQILSREITYAKAPGDKYAQMSSSELLDVLKDKAGNIADNYKNKTAKINWLARFLFRIDKKINRIELKTIRIENMVAPQGLFSLPNECLQEIAKHLDLTGLANFSCVNLEGKAHAAPLMLARAQGAGYQGQDVTEGRRYLKKLKRQLNWAFELNFIPKKYCVRNRPKNVTLKKTARYIGSFVEYLSIHHPLNLDKTIQKLKSGNFNDLHILTNPRLYENPVLVQFLSRILKDIKTVPLTDRQKKMANEALKQAIYSGAYDIAESLLRLGADANYKYNVEGASVLQLASRRGNTKIIDLLLKNGANIEGKDKDGQTALAHAVIAGKSATAEALIKKGADVNTQDIGGNTPLIIASNYTNYALSTQVMRVLLENGAGVDRVNYQGTGALHNAVRSNNPKMVKVLLEHKANVNLRNGFGKTPLYIARYYHCYMVIKLLKTHGAII